MKNNEILLELGHEIFRRYIEQVEFETEITEETEVFKETIFAVVDSMIEQQGKYCSDEGKCIEKLQSFFNDFFDQVKSCLQIHQDLNEFDKEHKKIEQEIKTILDNNNWSKQDLLNAYVGYNGLDQEFIKFLKECEREYREDRDN